MTEQERLRALEDRLWKSADQLRANSSLASSQYSTPVLGLIFLRYTDVRFTQADKELAGKASSRRQIGKADYQARGVMYVPETARFSYLRELPEGSDIGQALNRAMEAIEEQNPDLKGVLPRDYARFDSSVLAELLRLIGTIPDDIEGDAFGKIYEYFLGEFAMSEGQRGGEFFTPTSIVKLIVDVIEPFKGRILDPACGSGGMFVQSARFVEQHQKNPTAEISIFGQERVDETIRLAKMNLAVHGLGGEIVQSNTYYEDPHKSLGRFDFVIANPPFNVNAIDKDRIKDDQRYPFGIPSVDNGNYLWIQIFSSSLNDTGRAGFVMANSASDARHSELAIRRQLVEDHQVDVMVAIGSNFFYTVTLPVTLWFLDKAKRGTDRADKVLFLDARHIFRQIDRAHHDFTPEQAEFLANVVRLYRGEPPEFVNGSEPMFKEKFPNLEYVDVAGLCKVATVEEIETHGWSLNPGRYVGVADGGDDHFDFAERFGELTEELQALTIEATDLSARILDAAANSHSMRDWPTTTLGALCDAVQGVIRTGPFGSQLHQHDYVDDLSSLPVVMPKDIIDGQIDEASIARIDHETAARLAVHRMRKGDIVMARRGDVGRRALVDDRTEGWLCGTGSLRVSLPGGRIDPTFLYYYMGTDGVVGWLRGQAVGATMPNLNTDIVRRLEVPLPPIEVQRKIAAVLAAYDELIENNLRRIEILEEMAQALYREWFVNFRFPGHEDVPLVASPRGARPDGWSESTVGESARNFDRLRKPLSKMQRNAMQGDYPYYGAAKVFDRVNDYIFDGEYLLVAEDGSVATSEGYPVLQMASGRFWANNHTHILQGLSISTHHLYLALQRVPITGYVTGAAQPKITQGALNRIPLLVPTEAMRKRFDETVRPMFDLRQNLLVQNENLRSTRDLLLPKLLSGEIDVSALDVDTAWLAS